MKIAIAGAGYVGLSLGVLLSQHNEVIILDVVPEKIDLINNHKSPFKDSEIEDYLVSKSLNLTATLDYESAFAAADFIIIATPTNYDSDKNYFDTSSVDLTIEHATKVNPTATIVIKSTIPVGYTTSVKQKYSINDIFFSPEFLREGKALYDNLYPSRIVIGSHSESAKTFANLLHESAIKKDVPILFAGATEAEAIKLFSNTYLALRIAYFNELDTYAEIKGLNSKEIINGVCLDPRIGNHYNNPSFGYGGYCLPKDTKQLLADYDGVPQEMITAIVTANQVRKSHIVNEVLIKNPSSIGIYRLTMKKSSDNFRESAIQDIINQLKSSGKVIYIYEPTLQTDTFDGITIIKDLAEFKQKSDLILANRLAPELADVKDKIYTRDIFGRD